MTDEQQLQSLVRDLVRSILPADEIIDYLCRDEEHAEFVAAALRKRFPELFVDVKLIDSKFLVSISATEQFHEPSTKEITMDFGLIEV